MFVIDPRQRTGAYRKKFLVQSLADLKATLRSMSSDLLILEGLPEDVLPPLLPQHSLLVTQEESTAEEMSIDRKLRSRLEEKQVTWESL